MTDTTNDTTAAPAANLAPWHVFAAEYRAGLAAYMEAIKDTDEDDAAHDAHKVVYQSLLAYPVTTPHQLAEKAELLIADCWDDGEALGAIAADALIVAHADQSRRAAWEAALAVYEAADVALATITAAEERNGMDSTDEWNAAYGVRSDALEALLNTRAPDGTAMGVKARLVLIQAHEGFIDESVDDSATISQWLASGWDEAGFAALYQDGLALAGETGDLVNAKPDAFDAEEWLAETEAATGSRLIASDPTGWPQFVGGPDVTVAERAIEALRNARREAVHAIARARGAA